MTRARLVVDAAVEGGCSHCAGQIEGDRRKELFNLGWRPLGVVATKWFNPSSTYYVDDAVIDELPPEEWQFVLEKTRVDQIRSTHVGDVASDDISPSEDDIPAPPGQRGP